MKASVMSGRPRARTWRLILGSVFLSFGTIVAVAGPSANASAASALPSTLVWGISSGPRTLFGPTDYDYFEDFIMTLIQGQMLVYGPQEQLEPGIISSWKTVSPLQYQYTVRAGAKFSDGNPVTAADVAYTLNLQLNQKLASQEGGLFANVKSVTYSGDVVTINLAHPDALVRQLPASEVGLVYEKASVEKNMLNYGTPAVLPIGAGPYKLSSWTDSQLTLVRNPYFYGPTPHFASVIFKIIPDPETMLLALRSGEIDGTFPVMFAGNTTEFAKFGTLEKYVALNWNGLTMDMTEFPFSNIHVREALYYATNRSALASGAGDGLAEVSSTVNQPQIFGNVLPASELNSLYSQVETFPYSVAKAKQQLAMSPVPHGFTTTLNIPEDDPTDTLYGELLKSEWAQIGVTLNLRMMPGGPRFQIILNHAKNLGVQIIGNSPDDADPNEMNWEYFSSQQAAVNGNNSSNLRVPAIDNLISAAQAAPPAVSAKDTMEAAILASKYVPIIPISWVGDDVVLHSGWSLPGLQPFSCATYWTEDIQG
ncbi:MAG: ABC transporter substrate-binding protein [Acidimicrobiales bacterium]